MRPVKEPYTTDECINDKYNQAPDTTPLRDNDCDNADDFCVVKDRYYRFDKFKCTQKVNCCDAINCYDREEFCIR